MFKRWRDKKKENDQVVVYDRSTLYLPGNLMSRYVTTDSERCKLI